MDMYAEISSIEQAARNMRTTASTIQESVRRLNTARENCGWLSNPAMTFIERLEKDRYWVETYVETLNNFALALERYAQKLKETDDAARTSMPA